MGQKEVMLPYLVIDALGYVALNIGAPGSLWSCHLSSQIQIVIVSLWGWIWGHTGDWTLHSLGLLITLCFVEVGIL